LKKLNLKIEAGTTNAIVGESGFGKTTLFNLLFRIFDPTDGKITIDNQDIR
jgi:ABC-type multidrug transport system fused ATPase/permease subunit